jgi:hypothetical protein
MPTFDFNDWWLVLYYTRIVLENSASRPSNDVQRASIYNPFGTFSTKLSHDNQMSGHSPRTPLLVQWVEKCLFFLNSAKVDFCRFKSCFGRFSALMQNL